MVDVFISYSRANQDVVRRLADAIGGLGYIVWWDEELPAHLSYGEVITEKIGEAKATLVVWSRESAASEWVRAEADMARNQKTLIQTAIDDCTPPLPFNQIQYAAIGDWTGEADHPGWRKAKASLAALCGPAPASAESPAAEPTAGAPAAPAPVAAPVPPVMPAPVPAAPPAAVRRKPVNRTTRLAFGAIAASALTILTVGGLVLIKGPPTARASGTAPAPAAPVPAPSSAPAVVPGPPKAVVVNAPVQSPAESAADEGEMSEVDNVPDVRDDF